ncbi:MAG: hypothetical protein JWL69_1854 [Phycisphaerales bacterium]|nr:hypothetical protein [Phycisphaerales bacterium]
MKHSQRPNSSARASGPGASIVAGPVEPPEVLLARELGRLIGQRLAEKSGGVPTASGTIGRTPSQSAALHARSL